MEKPSYIDWWIVPHFLSWALIVGWLAWAVPGFTLPWALVVVGFGSIAWEAIEYERESYLLESHEEWRNRLIVDPISNTLGALAGWLVVTQVLAGWLF